MCVAEWLIISYVRNICAHYGRLYNAKLSKTPMLYKEYTQAGIANNRIFENVPGDFKKSSGTFFSYMPTTSLSHNPG